MPAPSAIVGAYASLPATPEDRDAYYRALAALPGVRGLEIPFRDDLGDGDGVVALAARLAPHWDRSIVTAVPGTMVRVWAEPSFGLVFVTPEGRAAALALTRRMRDAVEALTTAAGRPVVAGVELHSAPSGVPGRDHSAAAFGESLAEAADWDWCGAVLLVEHCDAYVSPDRGEKRLLPIEDEIAVLRSLGHPGVRMSLNWGRSALEAQDAAAPLEHVRLARSAGLLEGITFSGAAPVDTRYARAWMDGHLPLSDDEPASVMTPDRVRECAAEALDPAGPGAPASYLGAKCQVPAEADLTTRVAMLRRILDATGALAG